MQRQHTVLCFFCNFLHHKADKLFEFTSDHLKKKWINSRFEYRVIFGLKTFRLNNNCYANDVINILLVLKSGKLTYKIKVVYVLTVLFNYNLSKILTALPIVNMVQRVLYFRLLIESVGFRLDKCSPNKKIHHRSQSPGDNWFHLTKIPKS